MKFRTHRSLNPWTRTSLVLTLCLLSGVDELHAQNKNPDDWISGRIRFVHAAENDASPLHYMHNGEWTRHEMKAMSFSQAIEYRGPKTLSFYSATPGEGSNLPAPLASTTLPGQEDGEWIFVFIPKAGDQGKYHIYVISKGEAAFPVETVLFANLSRGNLAGTFNAGSVQLGPGENTVVSYNETEPSTALRIRIAARERQNDSWSLIYNATHPSRGSDRRWLILYTRSKVLVFPDYKKRSTDF